MSQWRLQSTIRSRSPSTITPRRICSPREDIRLWFATAMASIALQSSARGRWHSKGHGLRNGSSGTMRSNNASGMRQPSSVHGRGLHDGMYRGHWDISSTLGVVVLAIAWESQFMRRKLVWAGCRHKDHITLILCCSTTSVTLAGKNSSPQPYWNWYLKLMATGMYA